MANEAATEDLVAGITPGAVTSSATTASTAAGVGVATTEGELAELSGRLTVERGDVAFPDIDHYLTDTYLRQQRLMRLSSTRSAFGDDPLAPRNTPAGTTARLASS